MIRAQGILRGLKNGTAVVAALACAACAGSGPGSAPDAGIELHQVKGSVLASEKPVEGVEVRLYPLNQLYDNSAPHPYGKTNKEGQFQLRVGETSEGAPAGQYLVTLVWPGSGGKDRLGGTFAEPEGSGLTAVIEDRATNLPPFRIGSPGGQTKAIR